MSFREIWLQSTRWLLFFELFIRWVLAYSVAVDSLVIVFLAVYSMSFSLFGCSRLVGYCFWAVYSMSFSQFGCSRLVGFHFFHFWAVFVTMLRIRFDYCIPVLYIYCTTVYILYILYNTLLVRCPFFVASEFFLSNFSFVLLPCYVNEFCCILLLQ